MNRLIALLPAPLVLFCMPALAATATGGWSITRIVWAFVALVGIAIVFAILYYGIEKAPLITPPWKTGLQWLLYAVAGLVLIFAILKYIVEPNL